MLRRFRTWSQALRIEPKNPRLLNTRGYLHLVRGDLDAALADFNVAVGIDLKYPQPYNNRGLVWISRGEPAKAVADFDSALRIDPDYVDALNNRGYALTQLKKYGEAIASLTRATELDQNYVNAWNNRGLAYHFDGKFEQAASDFTRSIELEPENRKYFIHRAESLAELGKERESQADMAHALWLDRLAPVNARLKLNPQDADALLQRARLRLSAEQYDAALADVAAVLSLVPASSTAAADAYVTKAQILVAQKDYAAAVSAATVAIEQGQQVSAASVRGDAYFLMQKYELAISDYQAARRIDAQVQQAFNMHAEELEKSGQIEQAGFFREQAEALNPEAANAAGEQEARTASPFPTDATSTDDGTEPAAADAPKTASNDE
ncbi:MAG: tetratricopeptide repeat protein [Planctomycetaceae bacterium]